MHRNRTWTLDPPEWRTQRNRLLPIEGGDGSTLNLDFTTGVLDPRLTFSRASTATFVNSSGYVEYAGANLFLQSENLTLSPWLLDNGATRAQVSITNPVGGPTCTQINTGAGSNSIGQSPTYQAGLPHVLRIWVRAGTSSQLQIGFYAGGFVTGTPLKISGPGNITGTSFFFVNGLTDQWTQLEIKYASLTAGATFLFYPDTASPTGTKYVYVWGAQLNPGSTAQTYYPTTTAAYHAPRFDYSPTNIGEPRGLLVEGSAINTLLNSQRIDSAAGGWFFGGSGTRVTTPNYSTGPDGVALSATRLQLSQSASLKQLGGTNGTNNTVSVWAKSNTGSNQNMAFWTGSAASNKVITPQWQRFEAVVNFASLTAFDFYKPDAGDCDISIWGAQLELGSGASSYIPTGASTAQRVADNCFMSGINSWFNESAGTVITNCTYNAGASDNTGIELSVGTGNSATNRIGIRKVYIDYYSGGANSAEMTIVAPLENKRIIATAYSANNFAICGNGGTVSIDSAGAVPVGLNTLKLYADAGSETLNGTLKSIKYFPTRLSNDQLQTITSPNYVAPTLDINFTTMSTNADLTAKGITFTRLSNATMVNASGFVVSAPSNLIINSVLAGGSTSSTALSNPTGWLTGISGTSYRTGVVINSCNQWVQTASNQRPFITINIPQADLKPEVQYVASVYVDELSTGSNFDIIGAMLYYNAPTGTTVSSLQWVLPSGQTTGDGSGALTTGLLQLRFKLSVVGVSGFQIRLGIGTYANATGAVIFSRPQVEQAFSATSYIPNTSTVAPFYGPRFDYSSTNIGEKQGLLLEGQSINYLPYSNSFTIAAGWGVVTNLNTTAWTGFTAPDQSTNAVRLVPNTTNGAHRIEHSDVAGLSNNTQYTVSVWCKPDGYSRLGITASNNNARRNFVPASNASTGYGTSSTGTITAFAGGWYRVTMTFTTGAANTPFGVWLSVHNINEDPITSWEGNNTGGMQVWGVQVEEGSGASSYIPTGSSAVTRNADDCILTGTNFSSWYNPKEGSTFVQWTGGSGSNLANGRSYTLLNTTQTDQIFEGSGNGLMVYQGAFQVQLGPGLGTTANAAKVAAAFKHQDFAVSANGSNAVVQTSGSMPSLIDRLSIGGNYLNAAGYKFVSFKQFTYYPIRLTNVQLKALTS